MQKKDLAMITKTIKNNGSNEFIHSPFRYNGHQAYALGSIMSFVPPHTSFIEPFCGGAGLFFAKEKVAYNWLNDIDPELIAVYNTMIKSPQSLIKFFFGKYSEEEYNKIRDNLILTKEEDIAARWFYLNRTSRFDLMGKAWERDEEIKPDLESLEKIILSCSIKLQNTQITCGDFEKVIDSAPDESFIFMSPPYSLNHSSEKIKKYAFPFFEEYHLRLLHALERNSDRIKFLLTYPDSERVRNMYSWTKEIQPLKNDCLFIGDTTKKRKEEINEKSEEIIIKNF